MSGSRDIDPQLTNDHILLLRYREREAVKELLRQIEPQADASAKTIVDGLKDLFLQYDDIINQNIEIMSKLSIWKNQLIDSLNQLVDQGKLPKIILERLGRLDQVQFGGMDFHRASSGLDARFLAEKNRIRIAVKNILGPGSNNFDKQRDDCSSYPVFVHEALHLMSGIEFNDDRTVTRAGFEAR